MPSPLPIYEIEAEIVARLRSSRRLILQAPTGSGKSTQVPQMLLEHGFLQSGQAVILQPRRLAARLLAARVAGERNTALGQQVGYQIRFENRTGPETRLRYVTEGILLRQMIADPALRGVQALVFDEFHERHLYGDITLARALDLQESTRPDLLLLVMSATLETAVLEQYLQPCAVLASQGRTFPVDIEFASHRVGLGTPVWELAADAFSRHAAEGGQGDVLIFMPGSYEISQTLAALRQMPAARHHLLLPLHGELPPREQDAAVARYQQPKIVVSTNVAETSLTIDGVRLVIDSGLARIPRYDANRGINTLLVEKISRAAADQRAGRAGRTAPGRCFRLWSSQEHYERPAHELPEVKRLDLAEVVLTLKAAGVADLRAFRWLEPPAPQGLANAETLLTDLGALDPQGHITPVGRTMLAFPLHPRYARMLLAAQQFGCVYHAALIAALTQGRDLLLRNPARDVLDFRQDQFGDDVTSDFWLLLRAWQYTARHNFSPDACRRAGINAPAARQVRPLLDLFLGIARDEGLDTAETPPRDEALRQCILIGFSDRVARRLDQNSLRCDITHGRRGQLARESVVQRSPLLVAAEIREVESSDRSLNTLLSLATAIELDWLQELFPADIQRELRVQFDPATKRVVAEEQLRFRELLLGGRRVEPPPADEAARLLAAEVAAGRIQLKHWDEAVEQWILRLNQLSGWCPELQLPPIADADRQLLVEQLCHGALSARDVNEREVQPLIRSWLSPAQQGLLDQHAPERLTLPNGRKPRVTYTREGQPYIAVRIQELYDVNVTPRIARQRVPVLVHILTPGMRPVQITQDLAGFWRDHYPRVKQELQRRYPKHLWR